MRIELKTNVSRRLLAVICSVWLAGGLLWAQEKNESPTNPAAPAAPPAVESAKAPEATESPVADGVSNAIATVTTSKPAHHSRHDGDNPKVVIGNNAEVREGETVDNFVVVSGNGTVNGKVLGNAVVVGGELEIRGEVKGNAVAVLGGVHAHSNAVVRGNAVSVGGDTDIDPGATVQGEKVGVPLLLPRFDRLAAWFNHCVRLLRPMAPQVGWVWIVAGVVFLCYLLVALILQMPVQTCTNELTRRPVTTFFTALLILLAAPIVTLILTATVIGLIVVPFLWAALFFAAIIGKVALIEYIGDSLRRAVGGSEPLKPVIALCAGTLLILICYNIPILGLLTFALLAVWGLGVGVTAAFGSFKRESPQKPEPTAPVATPVGQPGFIAPMPLVAAAESAPQHLTASTTLTVDAPEASVAAAMSNPAAPGQPMAAAAPPLAQVPEALAYPRAGFWERMGAAFLDVVIVGILSGLAGGFLSRLPGHPPYVLLVALAYFAGMWAWKGTTVGGVVLNLKVVRLDNGPVTFPVALVRGLGAALSAAVFFLGFLWIAWDPDKQGWHDRIAGTVVIRLPRGTPLVCL